MQLPKKLVVFGPALLLPSSFIDPFRQKEMLSYLIKTCREILHSC